MSAQPQYSRPGYMPPIPSVVPEFDMGEVRRELRAPRPSTSKGRAPTYSIEEILGTSRSVPPEELHRRANLYFLEGKWQRTISTLEQLLKVRPSAESYFLAGICYVNIGDFPNAIRTLGEAVGLDPNNYMRQFHLASAYMMQYIATGDRSELEKAIPPYKKVISLGQQREGLAALGLGFVYTVLGDWRQAEKYYRKALELGTDPSSTYQQLAKLYMDMGDAQSARKEHYYLKAARTFDLIIKANPRNSDAYNFLGHIYQSIGKVEPALEAYQRSVELDDHNLLALANLTSMYLDAKRYEEARELHRHLLQIRPQEIREYITGKLQRPPQDVARYRSDAYLGYGVACMELYRVRSSAAEESADQPGQADPGLLEEAEKAFRKAIELDPANASAYYDLAVLYYRQNRLEDAQAAVRQALAIEPGNEKIREHVQQLMQETLQQRLLARGVIRKIREPITDFRPYRNRPMASANGPLLSELVIEGRR